VSKAAGGVLPGVDLNRSSDLEEVMKVPRYFPTSTFSCTLSDGIPLEFQQKQMDLFRIFISRQQKRCQALSGGYKVIDSSTLRKGTL
jgi:hypothetical protein